MIDYIFKLLSQSWLYAEPLIGYGAISSALIYFLKVRAARRKKYKNRGGKTFIVALQVGRPVAEAVKEFFGELDYLVDAELILGKPQLGGAKDYKKIATEIYKAVAANQNCPIKIVLSGPIGLSCLIGQLIGISKFDVEIHQFDPISKKYLVLPSPNIDWLKR